MKKLFVALLAALALAGVAHGAGKTIPLDPFPRDRLNDMVALQNGARLFVNHCLNCHAAAHKRYNRLRDIGLTDEQIKNNLLFTGERVGDLMKIAMDPRDARRWFGMTPPDLTLIARSRAKLNQGSYSGLDYLYTLMRSYYRDENTPTGWNNLAFRNIGMPNIFWEEQGERRPVFETRVVNGAETQVFTGRWEQVTPGTMTPQQYDEMVADLVAYLAWMGEPMRADRIRIGVAVLIFLGLFTVIAWRLNAVYWKDVK
jgi:ubiquinol-cytochrome c reductase cytochrome c1 subunit